MPSRDVSINLIGHDRTGNATRSAGNNLDQLARKIDKFNGKTIGDKTTRVKTKVDTKGAEASAGKLKRTFAKAGGESGKSFASNFRKNLRREFSTLRREFTPLTRAVESIGQRAAGFGRAGSRAGASFVSKFQTALRPLATKVVTPIGSAIQRIDRTARQVGTTVVSRFRTTGRRAGVVFSSTLQAALRPLARVAAPIARISQSFGRIGARSGREFVRTFQDSLRPLRSLGRITASVGRIGLIFGRAGSSAARSFASRFRRKISSMTQRVRLKIRVDEDVDNARLGRLGKRFTAALGNAMANVVNDGSRAIGNAIKKMALAAPEVAGPAIILVAARLAGLLGQAITAAFGLALGPGLLAAPIAFLLRIQQKASTETVTQAKKVATLKRRLDNETNKSTKARLQKQLVVEERILEDMRKQSQQWDNLKTKAKSFMQFISAPLKIPLQDSINQVFQGLERLKGPVRGIMTALGTALPGFTKGVMDTFLNFINALKPALPGIVAGMQAWGQELPKIGTAFGNMIAKIMANPDQVVTAVQNVSQVLQSLASGTGTIVSGLTRLGNAFFAFSNNIDALESKNLGGLTSAFGNSFRQVTSVIYQEVIQWLTLLFKFTSAWAKINPLMRPVAAAIGNTLAGVSADFANMKQKWFETDEAFRRRKIKAKITADITNLQTKLATAKAKLKDPTLSKAKKVQIRANIADLELKIATGKAKLTSLAKKKTVSKLQATKKDLEAKIRAAKASLKGVHDKKTIAKIKADIAQAEAQLRKIKAQIAGVKGKTVTVSIVYSQRTTGSRPAGAAGQPGGGSGGRTRSLTAGWQAALAGGATSRTAPPTVNVAPAEVSTRVIIDGRDIRAAARTTVVDENRRNTWRARVGRR